jgi:hypothetical protein
MNNTIEFLGVGLGLFTTCCAFSCYNMLELSGKSKSAQLDVDLKTEGLASPG